MQRKQRIEFSVETKVPKEMNRKHRNYHMPFSPSFIVFTFEQTHAQIILNGYQNDLATVTKLTHKFSDLKAMRNARDLFLSIPRPDLFLFNVVIRGFAANAAPYSAISLYTHLRKNTNLKPDKFTYAFAVSAASGFKDEKYGIFSARPFDC
ncbi:hypothetical protein ACFX2A_017702 [Malus domestica]